MAVYPKGEKFMASVGTGSIRVRKTFAMESEALAWEVSQEAAMKAQKALDEALPVSTVWSLQDAYDQTLKHAWKGKGGEYKAKGNASQALAFFGSDTLTSDITSQWIVEWMEELQDQGNGEATCNRKLSSLSMMLKRATDFGGLTSLPRIKLYKESKHRVAWFSDTDEAAMLETCTRLGYTELHDFIVIGIDTGFRLSELLHLTTNDYLRGCLLLHAGETKSGNARSVPCSTRVRAIIAKRQQEIAYRIFPTLTASTLRTQWQAVRGALNRLEDPSFIIHVLRHTCATRLVGEGVSLAVVKEWMGHATINTTMRYAHLAKGQMEAAGALLDGRKAGTGETA